MLSVEQRINRRLQEGGITHDEDVNFDGEVSENEVNDLEDQIELFETHDADDYDDVSRFATRRQRRLYHTNTTNSQNVITIDDSDDEESSAEEEVIVPPQTPIQEEINVEETRIELGVLRSFEQTGEVEEDVIETSAEPEVQNLEIAEEEDEGEVTEWKVGDRVSVKYLDGLQYPGRIVTQEEADKFTTKEEGDTHAVKFDIDDSYWFFNEKETGRVRMESEDPGTSPERESKKRKRNEGEEEPEHQPPLKKQKLD